MGVGQVAVGQVGVGQMAVGQVGVGQLFATPVVNDFNLFIWEVLWWNFRNIVEPNILYILYISCNKILLNKVVAQIISKILNG